MARHGFPGRAAGYIPPGEVYSTGKFGRLLPSLDPLRADETGLRELASTMLESSGGAEDNPGIPAAYTYFGQFVDHNITFDTTTIEESRVDPAAVTNYRSPRLDLDSVYGSGPAVQPHLYQREDPDLFEIGAAKKFKIPPGTTDVVPDIGLQADLPRCRNRFALIGDPRNDESLILAQLHVGFLFFHNNIVKWLRADPSRRQAPLRKTVFIEARDLAIRHYQWVILHDFLPRIVLPEILQSVLDRGSILSRRRTLFMPVEFAAAAYRYGHSMVRPQYNVSAAHTAAPLASLLLFTGRTGSRARAPIPYDWIVEWYRLLHLDPALDNTLSRRIDPYLSDELSQLPVLGGSPESLPAIDLLRGNMLGLPAGQSVAAYFGYAPLTPEEIRNGVDGQVAAKYAFDRDTPLWYYILKEALIRAEGKTLGPVGARLVAEVFIGLLELDENSILNRVRCWQPVLPSKVKGMFTLEDLLRFAGVLADNGPGPSLLEPCGYAVLDSCYSADPQS